MEVEERYARTRLYNYTMMAQEHHEALARGDYAHAVRLAESLMARSALFYSATVRLAKWAATPLKERSALDISDLIATAEALEMMGVTRSARRLHSSLLEEQEQVHKLKQHRDTVVRTHHQHRKH